MLSPERALQAAAPPTAFTLSRQAAAIYALAAGAAREPGKVADARLVSGTRLAVLPALASVMMAGPSPLFDLGVDLRKVLHGEQRLVLYRPLESERDYLISERVSGLYDKGAGKDALVLLEKSIRESDGGALVCTSLSTAILRGEGGFGGSRDGAPEPHGLPDRPPDLTLECITRSEQAALFSLLGDTNPLHLDIEAARRAGFDRPILHGLCTYAVACHALLGALLEYDPARIKAFDARFAAPVYPGDRLLLDVWEASDAVSFRMRCPERDSIVLTNGRLLRTR
jgi:acyl dehydratase